MCRSLWTFASVRPALRPASRVTSSRRSDVGTPRQTGPSEAGAAEKSQAPNSPGADVAAALAVASSLAAACAKSCAQPGRRHRPFGWTSTASLSGRQIMIRRGSQAAASAFAPPPMMASSREATTTWLALMVCTSGWRRNEASRVPAWRRSLTRKGCRAGTAGRTRQWKAFTVVELRRAVHGHELGHVGRDEDGFGDPLGVRVPEAVGDLREEVNRAAGGERGGDLQESLATDRGRSRWLYQPAPSRCEPGRRGESINRRPGSQPARLFRAGGPGTCAARHQ